MEFPALLVIGFLVLSNWQKLAWSTKQTYIVHVKNNHNNNKMMTHAELCTSSLASVSTSDQMLYLYTHAIPGYSATLTKQEARSLRTHQNILSVRPQTTYQLHTTRTPHFLGLDQHDDHDQQQQLPESAAQQLVIIGVLDSGVWPESQSFDDTGYGPISETRWNGTCEANIRCNNKLVGARSFSKAYEADPTTMDLDLSSALDFDGHGTHVMSTAGGSAVPNASLFGYANGTARGMAPYARLAAYKVCWAQVCRGADILAGMDQAIEDRVDVLSMSIGSGLIGHDAPYYNDPIAMGAFAAVRKGIFVSCSAGNSGPTPSVMANTAPWIATVGAGTLDRDFPAYVVLGNGKRYHGVSLYNYPRQQQQQQFPIVYAGNASTNGSSLCSEGTLDPEKVLGKIVVCDRGGSISRAEKGIVVKRAGGRGMVLASTAQNREWMVADAHLLPATAVTESAGNEIKKYISSSTSTATATITFEGTKVGPGEVWPSPVVATFSSRGPNPETPHVLKPDLIAPGLNIIAAWPDTVGPIRSEIDDRRVEFNIVSGTSMSCPHVSGLAALLKAAHPDWSPAAIRSALMTTAYSSYKSRDDFFKKYGTILDEATSKAATPFGYGAGHVDPIAALDPGLVYDLSAEDYLNFLCAINYTSQQVQLIARNIGGSLDCDNKNKKYNTNDLNYPSFSVTIDLADHTKCGTVYVNHTRTLTNVGQPDRSTTYSVKLYSPSHSIKIYATPSTLTFNTPNDKKSYTVTFAVPTNMLANASQFGRIEWFDGKHTVGSPIAFSWM